MLANNELPLRNLSISYQTVCFPRFIYVPHTYLYNFGKFLVNSLLQMGCHHQSDNSVHSSAITLCCYTHTHTSFSLSCLSIRSHRYCQILCCHLLPPYGQGKLTFNIAMLGCILILSQELSFKFFFPLTASEYQSSVTNL